MNKQTYLGSRYCLEQVMGSGLTGTVYKAADLKTGQKVAVKIVHSRYGEDPRFAVRFRAHFRRLAGARHPNLVIAHDYGCLEGSYYIATEFVKGPDLATYLAQRSGLAPAQAVAVAQELCAAVEAAHELGVAACGLKPQNIFLTPAGRVQVTDIGLARIVSESGLSKTRHMLEAVGYISPEQARAELVGPASDVYSLGVILFQMLTGRLPFESDSAWSLVRMHAEEAPPSPRQFNSRLPAGLSAVVMRALEKSPASRYPTAAAMQSGLATALAHGETLSLFRPGIMPPAMPGLWPTLSGTFASMPGAGSRARWLITGTATRHLAVGIGLILNFTVGFAAASTALYPLSGIALQTLNGLGVRIPLPSPLTPTEPPVQAGDAAGYIEVPNGQPGPAPEVSSMPDGNGPTPPPFVIIPTSRAVNVVQAPGETTDSYSTPRPRIITATPPPQDSDERREGQEGRRRGEETDEDREINFSGTVVAMTGDTWMIGNRTVIVSARTEIEGIIGVGDRVKVEAVRRSDGSWLAREIGRAEDDEEEDDEHKDDEHEDDDD